MGLDRWSLTSTCAALGPSRARLDPGHFGKRAGPSERDDTTHPIQHRGESSSQRRVDHPDLLVMGGHHGAAQSGRSRARRCPIRAGRLSSAFSGRIGHSTVQPRFNDPRACSASGCAVSTCSSPTTAGRYSVTTTSPVATTSRDRTPEDLGAGARTVMLLQSDEGLSNQEACDHLERDLVWQVAYGIDLGAESFRPTTLVPSAATFVPRGVRSGCSRTPRKPELRWASCSRSSSARPARSQSRP